MSQTVYDKIMQFVKVEDWRPGIEALYERLKNELTANKKVLWLVPGGSNIAAAVQLMSRLPDELTTGLAIMLTDERYGEVGHPDSNMQQLLDAGFSAKKATVVPVLVPGLSADDTATRFGQAFERAVGAADVVIGQFGIGTDGHIAGILPASVAARETTTACAYEAPKFQRITLTFPALKRLSCAYALVFGVDKQATLQNLHNKELALDEQPSQILKQLPEAYVYNDQIGEER